MFYLGIDLNMEQKLYRMILIGKIGYHFMKISFQYSKKGIGKYINNAGYKVLKIDFENKNILELGPGSLLHKHYWKNKPKSYVGIDIKKFLDITKNMLNVNSRVLL